MECGGSGIVCAFLVVGYLLMAFWPIWLGGIVVGVTSLLLRDSVKKSAEVSPVLNSAFKKTHIVGCITYMVGFIAYHTYIMSSFPVKYQSGYVFPVILLFYLILFYSRKDQWISFLIIFCMTLCWFYVLMFNMNEYLPYSSGTIIRYVGYFALIIGLISCTYLYLRKRYYLPEDKIADLHPL